MTDDELMKAIAQRDSAAYNTLANRHVDRLYRYALRLSGDGATAEDLVQDAWVTVWEKPQSYKPGKVKFVTWLHRVLYNRFVDQLRRDRIEYTDQTDKLDRAETTEFSDTRMQAFNQALTRLPEQQKAALLLSHMQGFSNPEVAHIMGLTVRAVESLQARARKSLTSIFNER